MRDRWCEYLECLLAVNAGGANGETVVEVNEDSDECGPILASEVRSAIGRMQNGKSPGVDGVTAEMLKCGGKSVEEWMLQLCNLCWDKGVVPSDWRNFL